MKALYTHYCISNALVGFLLLLLLQLPFCSSFSISPARNGGLSLQRNGADGDTVLSTASPLQNLKVAIVGGGPSGLLLAHKLLQTGATIHLFEVRPRPLLGKSSVGGGRTYALGVGQRGRTAIQSVVPSTNNNNKADGSGSLWNAIKQVGFGSERFQLHIGPFTIRLRDGDGTQEPSLLLFQSDLCAALLNELEQQSKALADQQQQQEQERLQVDFNVKVVDIDLNSKTLTTAPSSSSSDKTSDTTTTTTTTSSFDLIVGCDGVNSVVRQAIQTTCPQVFISTKRTLPGQFKTVQLPTMPPKLDPTAVALLVPKRGTTSAFVEPAVGRCCVLFAGSNQTDPVLASSNVEEIRTELTQRFPLLKGNTEDDDANILLAAQQLAATAQASQAASVLCNIYHYLDVAVLCGDAAHATGGVSGQGVNSALVDSVVLADCLVEHATNRRHALLQYSQRQVPEGHALYELSFPPPPKSPLDRIRSTFKEARDFLFQGKILGIGQPPLQVTMTTSLESFATIRRNRQDRYGGKIFPDPETWEASIAELDAKTQQSAATTTAREAAAAS